MPAISLLQTASSTRTPSNGVQAAEAHCFYGSQIMEGVRSKTCTLLIDTYIKDSAQHEYLFPPRPRSALPTLSLWLPTCRSRRHSLHPPHFSSLNLCRFTQLLRFARPTFSTSDWHYSPFRRYPHKQPQIVRTRVVLLPFHSPNQISIVHANGCG